MGKRIWEFIDLDERVNFPLYFPVEGDVMSSPDRRPLYNVLINGIKEGTITEVYDSSYFTTKKTLKDIEASLFKVDTTDVGREQMNEDIDAYRNGTKLFLKNISEKLKSNLMMLMHIKSLDIGISIKKTR